jgi:pimeloyl-ACP methyl ester carboxylesterase
MRFVLVHGGFHGAWCWERLIPELEQRGHSAAAVELPGHGKRIDQDASLEGYRDAVLEVIEPGDILVGHSMGGFVTSMAADAAVDRIRHVVYLAAGLPKEGQTMQAAGADKESMPTIEIIDGGRRMKFRTDAAATAFFYHDCSPEIARWACSRLTPQPLALFVTPISIPRFWRAELPRSLILCRQDRAAGSPAAAEHMAERLGVEPFYMDTSHSPFLSQPAMCAELILEAIRRPPIAPLRPH